jgi:general stress protein 26
MNPIALKLLEKERICVLSVVLADGSPHGAVVHYSQQTEIEPVKIFIQTSPTVKTEAIKNAGGAAKASVVIGLNEADFVTLQMRGNVRIVSDTAELENIYKTHYAKHPEAEQYKSPKTIFLEFVPTWWRYTDFNTDPETIIQV